MPGRSPAPARASSRTRAATPDDTNQLLGGEGTITCTASSGHTKLKVIVHAFISAGANKGSAAVCAFSVPTTLKHKKLQATETITYEGQKVTHTFTTTVK
jgi:hypothetical protein